MRLSPIASGCVTASSPKGCRSASAGAPGSATNVPAVARETGRTPPQRGSPRRRHGPRFDKPDPSDSSGKPRSEDDPEVRAHHRNWLVAGVPDWSIVPHHPPLEQRWCDHCRLHAIRAARWPPRIPISRLSGVRLTDHAQWANGIPPTPAGRQTPLQQTGSAPAAAHARVGGRQQSPARQITAGATQRWPQDPQLASSVWVLRQAPLQQVCPRKQVKPQLPQLASLVFRFLHTPLQQVNPAPQV